MANHASALKRGRQNDKRRARNRHFRSQLKTYIKKVMAAVEENNSEQAQAALKAAVPVIDKAVTQGLLHRNNAARKKSRLTKRVKALAS